MTVFYHIKSVIARVLSKKIQKLLKNKSRPGFLSTKGRSGFHFGSGGSAARSVDHGFAVFNVLIDDAGKLFIIAENAKVAEQLQQKVNERSEQGHEFIHHCILLCGFKIYDLLTSL